MFFDEGTVELLHERDRSGVLAAGGTVNGVRTIAFCTDGTVMGGAMGIEGCRHIVNAYDTAIEEQSPIAGIWHSGGARLAEGVSALHAVGLVFEAMIRASGYIPQISIVVGFAAGGAAYGPALTDVIIMAPESRVFVTGPDVVRSVTGEDVDMATLGGPEAHHKKSGVCHIVADDELDAYARGRKLIGFFCQQGVFDRGRAESDHTDLRALLPASAKRAYDVHPIVNALLDSDDPDETFEEFQGKWAPSMVIGLGRLAGRSVGVLANNPLRLGGCLNSESAEKAARFVRLCNAFGIPLIVLVDVPGYLPGVGQEWGGVVRRGAKLLHAFGEATVPRVTLVTRKIYGGAYIAMNSRSLGATKVFAWPDAEVAVMGAKAAVGILHKKQLAAAPADEREALHEELALEHERIAGGVDRAIEIGVVDEEIEPSQTRAVLTRALAEALALEHERIAGGVDRAIEIGVVDEEIEPSQTRAVLTRALAEAPSRRGRHKNIPL
ncbi:putative propionyl-CoA carboxylase beta chain 6 [Mycobacteroides salmoniphilum]|uniref:Propionyl-CoA carboxylase beta chain 6 n=2 Tax=Mycobacteroides salmoniphilum TaxID=404941 RepID=A0A4V3HZA2_9MYCO|nr:putative propionyl-CoA carboxylase beta chain 6 [Mycobacteroides salmoniphilum]TEA07456.1 putative propionyl-CoA carboxylase beta chain 6 [Mycobacteroides salmoniphilum]